MGGRMTQVRDRLAGRQKLGLSEEKPRGVGDTLASPAFDAEDGQSFRAAKEGSCGVPGGLEGMGTEGEPRMRGKPWKGDRGTMCR